MMVRLLKGWRGKQPGVVFSTPDGVANVLIRRQIAEALGPGDAGAEPPASQHRPPAKGRPKKKK